MGEGRCEFQPRLHHKLATSFWASISYLWDLETLLVSIQIYCHLLGRGRWMSKANGHSFALKVKWLTGSVSPNVAETWRNRLSRKAKNTLVLSQDFLVPFFAQRWNKGRNQEDPSPNLISVIDT